MCEQMHSFSFPAIVKTLKSATGCQDNGENSGWCRQRAARVWSAVVSIVARQSRSSTSAERANVAASEEAEMCLTMWPRSLTASCPRALGAHPRVRFEPLSSPFFFTQQGPTDGDVEAVDAEGGTPTLLETLLLGVGFHCSADVQPRSPLRSSASPPG